MVVVEGDVFVNETFRKHFDNSPITFTLRDAQREVGSDGDYLDTTERPYRSVRVEFERVPDSHAHLLQNPPRSRSSTSLPAMDARRSPTPPFIQTDESPPLGVAGPRRHSVHAGSSSKATKWWQVPKRRRINHAEGTMSLDNYFCSKA